MTLPEGRIEKFTGRYCLRFAPEAREEFIAEFQAIIAEPEAERDLLMFAVKAHERNLLAHSERVNMLGDENALLRKALEAATADETIARLVREIADNATLCAALKQIDDWGSLVVCSCGAGVTGALMARAALARIPEAKL